MADNTKIDIGTTGDTIATDEIAGVKFPRSKIVIGIDGTNAGDVAETNPLPTKGRTVAWAAPTFVTVGVASTIVLLVGVNRLGAVFVNDSSATIYLGIGGPAVIGRGIRLNANGGSYEINLQNLTTQNVNAIATAASSNLTVHEAT